MVIFNNMAAMSALNETNRNTSKLGKVIKQAASGIFSFATNPYTNNPAYKLNGSNGTYNYIAEVDLSALSSSVADIPKGFRWIGLFTEVQGNAV